MANCPRKIELLSPAGTEDAFRAAMHNGADAIYLGAGPNHARQAANGITEQLFFELSDTAHAAGVKVYLTLNTLLRDDELKAACDWAERAWNGGADAIIIQDIGLLRLLHSQYPEMVLHASTQMSLHNLDGVLAARNAGVTRVVLARELSIDAIAGIRLHTETELEVFVHGALCVSYSGQCLMSSLNGGRSGNRGTCAQPCRMAWQMPETRQGQAKEGYLLSMKDLMALELLPQLLAAGVTSIKIEGRMKSPEYVALVTDIYRRHLDRLYEAGASQYFVEPEDEKALRQIFNRGGFTNKYLIKKDKHYAITGRQPFGTVNEAAPPTRLQQDWLPTFSQESLPDEALGKDGDCQVSNFSHTQSSLAREADSLVFTSHPKHLGIAVGIVKSYRPPYAEVSLTEELSLGDGIEIHAEKKGGENAVSFLVTDIIKLGKRVRSSGPSDVVWLGDVKKAVYKGDLLYRTYSKNQMQSAAQKVAHWRVKRVPITMKFSATAGEKAVLEVSDQEGNVSFAYSREAVELARDKPLAADRVIEQLQKTGDSAWLTQIELISVDGKGTMQVAEINFMRRDALADIYEKRVNSKRRSKKLEMPQIGLSPGAAITLKIANAKSIGAERVNIAFTKAPSVEFLTEANLARAAGTARLLIPVVQPSEFISIKQCFPGSIWIRAPYICTDAELLKLRKMLSPIIPLADGFSTGNMGILKFLRELAPAKPLLAEEGMNLWNASAVAEVARLGADIAVLSPELTSPDADALSAVPIMISSWSYGRVPVMKTAVCPGSQRAICSAVCRLCAHKTGILKDHYGAEYFWERDLLTETTTIYHHSPIKRSKLGLAADAEGIYLFITDESPSELAEIVDKFI